MRRQAEAGGVMEMVADFIEEGQIAFIQGVPATGCPYSFANSSFWAHKDYTGFNRECRWKLDAWMCGWIDAKKKSNVEPT